jgi:hypothetical protein
VPLKEALAILPENLHYGSDNAAIRVKNLQNANFEDVKINFKSAFFEHEETISLKPFESKNISIAISSDKIKKMTAGSYVVSADVELQDARARIEGILKYLEKQDTSITRTTEGILVRTTTILKKNEGNTEVNDRIEITKNVLTRLFTTFSVEPMTSERSGLVVKYSWEKNLKPSDSWNIIASTNYTFPFLLVLLVLFAASMVYIYSRTSVVLNKRVSFVKTTGGHFALKVTLHLKARKRVDGVEITDRLPMATKLYEKAGMPHHVDAQTRRLMWNVGKLNAGEERIYSYIIYSNIRIVGRFELPNATAKFVKDGLHENVYSNKTYFVSDVHPRY